MKTINILNKTYSKNNSCDDQFFYLADSFFWYPIVDISVCSHSVPSEGFNSLPETQVNTYLFLYFTIIRIPVKIKRAR